MKDDITKLSSDMGTFSVPRWVITVVIAVVSSLMTYSYSAGVRVEQSDQVRADLARVVTQLDKVNADLSDLKSQIGELKSKTDLHTYQLNEIKNNVKRN